MSNNVQELKKICECGGTEQDVKYWMSMITNINALPYGTLANLYNMVGQKFFDILIEKYPRHAARLAVYLTYKNISFCITPTLFEVICRYEDHFIILRNENFIPDNNQFKRLLGCIYTTSPYNEKEYHYFYDYFKRNEDIVKQYSHIKRFLKFIIVVTDKKLFKYLINVLISADFPLIKLSSVILKRWNNTDYFPNVHNLALLVCYRTFNIVIRRLHLLQNIEYTKFVLTQNSHITNNRKCIIPTNAKLLDYKISKSWVRQHPNWFLEVMQVDTIEKVLIKNWKLDMIRMLNYQSNLEKLIR